MYDAILASALLAAALVALPAAANQFRDNPAHVVDRANVPWTSPIGELERISTQDGKPVEEHAVGTGFLVSPCYIMTAGTWCTEMT